MPWKELKPMDQKTQFVADYLRQTLDMTELCQRYGISRKTGYKWIGRYIESGPQGLEDRSRRPGRSPNQTPDEIAGALIQVRQRHPSWGAKKLLPFVEKRHPEWDLPGRSTVCDILKRHGLVPRQRRRRVIGHPGKPSSQMLAPNDIWCADFKGQFKTGDGLYCYPLTVTDGYSRYLLACQGLLSTKAVEAKPVFTRLFKEFGLPQRIRSDNGVPFATNTLARLMQRPGIGPVTASALLASIGNGHDFKNGRQVAAWIGLTPGQYSSGGKTRLGRITKAGDSYLRSLLVMGARAILSGLGDKQDGFSRWARSLVERRGYWRAVVAIAAKNARLAWAVLKYGEDFRLNQSAV